MTRKVLVIDDEVSMGEMIRDFLSDEGFNVWIATDADEGLQILEFEHPDLVLLDILLPGIGGLECLKRIKKRHPDMFVVMISGIHDESVAKQAIHRGAYDYITKPFDFQNFRNTVLQRLFPPEA